MKHYGVIRYDPHTKRWEYWYQSHCHAYSNDLETLMQKYPNANVIEDSGDSVFKVKIKFKQG